MALELSGILGIVLSWFSSVVFWFVVAIVILIGVMIILTLRKKRNLSFPAFEITCLKDGKTVIEHHKAGWFGKKKTLFGLMDYGKQKVMRLNDGRVVHDFSIDDYHEYRKKGKGKRAIIVTAHPEDKSMVVPISNSKLDSKSLNAVYEIAPADYRESAVEAFNDSSKELKGTMDRILPYVMLGGIIIFFIVGLVITGQIISKAVESSASMLADAGDTLEKVAQLVSSRPSITAP